MEQTRTLFTTAEAAQQLGIAHISVKSAIRLGTLTVQRINPRLNMVTAEAIETYRRDHLGRRGRRPRRTAATELVEHRTHREDTG